MNFVDGIMVLMKVWSQISNISTNFQMEVEFEEWRNMKVQSELIGYRVSFFWTLRLHTVGIMRKKILITSRFFWFFQYHVERVTMMYVIIFHAEVW